MSSYWAGYNGTGLILKQNEFDAFLEKYKEKNPTQADCVAEAIEDYPIDEVRFIMSTHAGEELPGLQEVDYQDCADKVFDLTELCNDDIDGFTFWPFFRKDGRMNVAEEKPDGDWEDAEMYHPMWEGEGIDRCYVIFSMKDFTSPRVFERPAYSSYEEFVQEFKDQVEAYLPEDFDWNAHLGVISYACYA